jgi:hypothetical protein
MPRGRRLVPALAFAAATWFSSAAFAPMARAIPEAEATKKLAVIPVFILTNDKGVPLPIPRDKALILPMYLERAKAEQELANFNKANPQVKAQLVPMPLNVANDKINALNKQLKDKSKPLSGVVVPAKKDRDQAVAILRQQGVKEQEILQGLALPVFFTKPFLTVNTPNGPKGVFFLSYDDLEKALAKLPNKAQLKPQAADLTAVLREIIKAKEDSFVIFPTAEYFRLVQEQQKSGGAPKAN